MNDQPTPTLRDRAIDAVGQALNDANYWLPVEGRPIAVDAVLALTGAELDASQRRAVRIQQLLDEQRDRIRKIHRRSETGSVCVHCSERDYPDYAVPYPCPTITALEPPKETTDA